MEPRFVSLPAFTLVGMMMRVRPGGKVPGQLWDEFGPRMEEVKHMTGPDMAYGLTANMDMGSGEFDYMAGVHVSSTEDIPEGMVSFNVPAQHYAVFPCTLPTLREVFDQIYGVWLPASGYARTSGPELELYGEAFDPRDPTSVFEVYIPVHKA
jgi:predicted transcriptional regulator YdeE